MEDVREKYTTLERAKTNIKEYTEKRETKNCIEVCINLLNFSNIKFIRFSFMFEYLILQTLEMLDNVATKCVVP